MFTKKKNALLLTLIVALILLLYLPFTLGYIDNIKNDKLPTPTPSPTSNVNKATKADDIKKVFDKLLPTDEENERAERILNQEIYYQAKSLTKKSQLLDLEKTILSTNDTEIRIWVIEPNISVRGFIFKYKDNEWSAKDIIRVNSNDMLRKRNIAEPLSGWKDWEIFIEKKLNPSIIENYNLNTDSSSGIITVIETRFGSVYSKNIIYDTRPDNDQLYEIIEKIKKEFYNGKIK